MRIITEFQSILVEFANPRLQRDGKERNEVRDEQHSGAGTAARA